MCEKDEIPQDKVSKNNKHCTALGLTVLSSVPLVWVMIFAGNHCNAMDELGVDLFAEDVVDVTDANYNMNDKGPGKRFPRGPSCYLGEKVIPCMRA